MLERNIEYKFTQTVNYAGGWALKLICPGTAGMPDRMVLLPGGRIVFVELKAPGRKLRPLQRKRFEQLGKLGFRVYKVDSREKIEQFMTEVFDSEV